VHENKNLGKKESEERHVLYVWRFSGNKWVYMGTGVIPASLLEMDPGQRKWPGDKLKENGTEGGCSSRVRRRGRCSLTPKRDYAGRVGRQPVEERGSKRLHITEQAQIFSFREVKRGYSIGGWRSKKRKKFRSLLKKTCLLQYPKIRKKLMKYRDGSKIRGKLIKKRRELEAQREKKTLAPLGKKKNRKSY